MKRYDSPEILMVEEAEGPKVGFFKGLFIAFCLADAAIFLAVIVWKGIPGLESLVNPPVTVECPITGEP